MNFLIFLDFDGVLHAHYGPYSERFYFLSRFEAVIREFPNAEVVVASSWGLHQNLATLRSYFSTDVQSRVIGISTFTVEQALTWYGKRHRIAAAQRYIEANAFQDRPWVAIDDVADFWRPAAPLIHCRTGFQEIEELLLRMVLSGELPAKPGPITFFDGLVRYWFNGDLKKADVARRLFAKHYSEEAPRTPEWFDSICATDSDFIDLLDEIPPRDELP
jgi:hypothetical protein